MLYLCRLSCGVEAIYDTLFALGQGRICEPLQNFNAKKKRIRQRHSLLYSEKTEKKIVKYLPDTTE